MAVKDIIIPKLSNEMDQAVLTSWEVEVGDSVEKGDIIFTVETEKTVFEVESEHNGVISKILVEEGTIVPLLSVVGQIEIDRI
jgi:pyruvate/2-oxoglutarate dehydrogenase complex dihydrolipoamide acyltransferase (E2) component